MLEQEKCGTELCIQMNAFGCVVIIVHILNENVEDFIRLSGCKWNMVALIRKRFGAIVSVRSNFFPQRVYMRCVGSVILDLLLSV